MILLYFFRYSSVIRYVMEEKEIEFLRHLSEMNSTLGIAIEVFMEAQIFLASLTDGEREILDNLVDSKDSEIHSSGEEYGKKIGRLLNLIG